MTTLETQHHKLKQILASMQGVYNVSEVIELPNQWGADTSSFSVKHHFKNDYNYRIFDFNVDWSRNVLFVRLDGYFPFKNFAELQNTVTQKLAEEL